MITTVSVIIYFSTYKNHSPPYIVIKIYFLVMRIFKIYSFSNFEIYNTVLLTIIVNCTL